MICLSFTNDFILEDEQIDTDLVELSMVANPPKGKSLKKIMVHMLMQRFTPKRCFTPAQKGDFVEMHWLKSKRGV